MNLVVMCRLAGGLQLMRAAGEAPQQLLQIADHLGGQVQPREQSHDALSL